MIEARLSKVAPFKDAVSSGVKGVIAEGYSIFRSDMPGLRDNIPRTVTSYEVESCRTLLDLLHVMNSFFSVHDIFYFGGKLSCLWSVLFGLLSLR